jgi:hypothetical protein
MPKVLFAWWLHLVLMTVTKFKTLLPKWKWKKLTSSLQLLSEDLKHSNKQIKQLIMLVWRAEEAGFSSKTSILLLSGSLNLRRSFTRWKLTITSDYFWPWKIALKSHRLCWELRMFSPLNLQVESELHLLSHTTKFCLTREKKEFLTKELAFTL